ncbi:MAG: hypothetical protein HBSAPP03_21530 [Phycisphaerae bacterium]|nr:MAG: hypothetical protein HBSAPP03_21530 [Phycisphaerae bacterium]
MIAVSPYHLTTREAPAMAALLLGTRVVTLAPASAGGNAAWARRAAGRVRAFADLARSWTWAEELFRAGVLVREVDGETPEEDVRWVLERLSVDDRYAALRMFLHQAEGDAHLAAISADILKGGPDPGLSIPVAAGLDRFAVRRCALVARSPAVSVAQKAEANLGTGVLTCAVPVLLQADAARLMHAREVMRRELDALRAAMMRLPEVVQSGARGVSGVHRDVELAAKAYGAAFEHKRADVHVGAEDDEVRLVESVALVSVVALPSDAVLASGVTALRSMGASGRHESVSTGGTGGVIVRHDQAEGRRVAGLVIKAMGTR